MQKRFQKVFTLSLSEGAVLVLRIHWRGKNFWRNLNYPEKNPFKIDCMELLNSYKFIGNCSTSETPSNQCWKTHEWSQISKTNSLYVTSPINFFHSTKTFNFHRYRLAHEYGITTEFTELWDRLQSEERCCGVTGSQVRHNVIMNVYKLN